MLTLILGRGKSGKTRALMNAVKDCPAEGMFRRIVLVPDQLSHQMERELSRTCGDEISYRAEVLSFSRLYSRICALYGGGARQTIDSCGRILTARAAVSRIRSRLHIYASAAEKAEFLKSIVEIIDELKCSNISSAQLLSAAEKSDGLLGQKLEELSLILDAYDASLAHGSVDPRDKFSFLEKTLSETDYAVGRHFFVDGFADYTYQELSILRTILGKCESMTVTVPCESIPGTGGIFSPGEESALRLKVMAESLGQDVRVIVCEHQRALPEELSYLERNLFAAQAEQFPSSADSISVCSAFSRTDECRRCAAVIQAEVRKGLRYRDIRVAAADSSYLPLIETVFASADIPVYTEEKHSITAQPAVIFLLQALRSIVGGLQTEDVIAYMKTGFCGFSNDDCDVIENYAFVWRISGTKWTKPWTMHPQGYNLKIQDDTREYLRHLNALREKLMAPLSAFRSAVHSADTVKDQVLAVYHFLENTGIADSLETEIAELTEDGALQQAQETAQVWETLLTCLLQLYSILGSESCSGESFEKLLKLALEQYQLGSIPSVLDAVSAGTLSSARGSEPKVLCVLGANEGCFPAISEPAGLLSDADRRTLKNSCDLVLSADAEELLERLNYEIYCTLTAPTEKLYISWTVDPMNERTESAFLVKKLIRLFDLKPTDISDMTLSPADTAVVYLDAGTDPAEKEAISRAAAEIPALSETIQCGIDSTKERGMIVASPDAVALFGSPFTLSPSKLDTLRDCPLSFFLNYGLDAEKLEQATFDKKAFGTYAHHVLELSIKALTHDFTTRIDDDADCQAAARAASEDYTTNEMVGIELNEREQYLFDRNFEEASLIVKDAVEELQNSSFVPVQTEYNIGKSSHPVLYTTDAGSGRLTGIIDRVDVWDSGDGKYVRIVDYKTGTKALSFTKLNAGRDLQMLVYLFALKNSDFPGAKDLLPAGILYFSAKEGIGGDSTKPAARSGMVLSREDILEAMEPAPGGRKKRKSVPGEKFQITEEQLKLLENFVEKQVHGAVSDVLHGQFAPAPLYEGKDHNPCQWCAYGDVCLKGDDFRRQHYHKPVTDEEFWQNIGGDGNEQ